MDLKELHLQTEQNNDGALSNQNITEYTKDEEESNGKCYVNKGFNNSHGSIEELSNKVEVIENINIPKTSIDSTQVGYDNDAFEDGPKKEEKGMVPLAHEITVISTTSLEDQSTKLDEDNNGVVAVNLETKEKKWKIQSVGWDSNRSIIFLGLILAFDAWAAIFYCFKTNILTNIFN